MMSIVFAVVLRIINFAMVAKSTTVAKTVKGTKREKKKKPTPNRESNMLNSKKICCEKFDYFFRWQKKDDFSI